MSQLLETYPIDGVRITATHTRVLDLLHARKTIAEMSDSLKIQESTIMSYISLLIKSGHHIIRADLKRLAHISDEMFAQIAAVFPTDATIMSVPLTPLKEMLPEHISYGQLRLVLAYQQVRFHLQQYAGALFEDPDQLGDDNEFSASDEVFDVGDKVDDDMMFGNIAETLIDMNMINDKLTDSSDDEEVPIKVLPRRRNAKPIDAELNADDDELMSQINVEEEIRIVADKENRRLEAEASAALSAVINRKMQCLLTFIIIFVFN